MRKKIFLIGFMAVGKSYLGKRLADEFNLEFYDIDQEIEKTLNMDVNNIFLEKGEEFFRRKEQEVLQNWQKDGIIATGGGILGNSQNREFLKQPENLVVWLNSSWSKIRSRLINSYRPMVLNRTEDELFRLFEQRRELYEECADILFEGYTVAELKKTIAKHEENN